RTLEERLNLVLFDRLPRGMRLTQAGQALLDYAERIFALDQAAERAMHELANLESGQLAIGASNTVGTYLLPAILGGFRARYPGIALSLEVTNTEHVVQGVREMRYALGFVEGRVADEAIALHEFRRDRIVAVVAPRHPLAKTGRPTLRMLSDAPAILRERGSGTREIVEDAFNRKGLNMQCGLEIGNSEAVKRVAMAGWGVGWVSELCVEDEVRSGKLIALPTRDLDLERPLYWIGLRERAPSRSVSAFIAFCFADPKPA
ncbi:MAG TPA: LysR substrate-binding domain-containing protein, partial [Nevskia sp.]|nr:LysR substrate-binding domain-containing protein [Nevskia sp.]